MTIDAPMDEEQDWRRRFASRANNRAWALAEQATRTVVEDDEMLDAAHASAHLWRTIGTDRNEAHANLLLAQVHGLLAHADAARRYADAAFDFLTTHPSEPWELALAHAVRGHAAFRVGDRTRHRHEYAKAAKLIDGLSCPEEQAILLACLRVIPAPDGAAA